MSDLKKFKLFILAMVIITVSTMLNGTDLTFGFAFLGAIHWVETVVSILFRGE